MKQLQWYPGHIAKTLNEFRKIHNEIDLFFVILDARAPKSTFLEQFKDIIRDKKVIIIISKSDLVDKTNLSFWINKYKKEYNNVLTLDLKNKKLVVSEIDKVFKNLNFKTLLVKTAILGVPNVGKSTFINSLINKSSSKVENRAGVTKTKTWFQYKNFWILDSPGILEPIFHDITIPLTLSLIGSIKLDILPLEEVYNFLKQKAIELKFDSKLSKETNDNEVFYLKEIKNFQNGKFGKIILEK